MTTARQEISSLRMNLAALQEERDTANRHVKGAEQTAELAQRRA